MLSLVVLISGSGSNLKALLEACSSESFPAHVVAVGSDTDASGFEHAENFGIPTFLVDPRAFASRQEWGAELAQQINVWQPDLVVCAGFMRVLPAGVITQFSPYIINMHPALLPLFPGAHAVRDALAAGVSHTGTTVHIVDEGVDTGPVIAQRRVDVMPGDAEDSLHERIKEVERELLVHTVRQIAIGQLDLQEIAQQ